jgi:hypothetical protein
MTEHQRKTFDAMCARFGITDAQKAEMVKFIEDVADTSRERGEVSGASPFDGTWPSENEI